MEYKGKSQVQDPQIIPSDHTISTLSAHTPPIASVQPGRRVQFDSTDLAYQSMSAAGIDAGMVDFREVNRLTGPVFVEGTQPGDALGFAIEQITLGSVAHVPYVSRWRYPTFPRARSSVQRYPIRNGAVYVSDQVVIDIKPMVGCIATAPANGKLSSLSPAAKTGGNLDLQQVREGATVWLPVEALGALFAIGDIHAAMGSNEPLGAGMECGGSITGVFHLAPGISLPGPRIESASAIHFAGSDAANFAIARQIAVRAAWEWLIDDCALQEEAALAVCAAAMDVSLGGPAGCNIVASFDIPRLRSAGVRAPLLVDEHLKSPVWHSSASTIKETNAAKGERNQ